MSKKSLALSFFFFFADCKYGIFYENIFLFSHLSVCSYFSSFLFSFFLSFFLSHFLSFFYSLSVSLSLSLSVPIYHYFYFLTLSFHLPLSVPLNLFIYIYIYIILSCWPSLATPPYRSSLMAGPLGYIPYPHRAAVCRFELVVLLFLDHVSETIGEHHLWAPPCFSSSVLHVWFV